MHIVPSFNKTGIKIKLLNALFNGKFVVANDAAVQGTGVSKLCEIANSGEEYIRIVSRLFNESFSENDIAKRKKILDPVYNNDANAHQLIQWIW